MFLTAVALVTTIATTIESAVIDATFARWEAAAHEMKSLQVEYTSTETSIFGRETCSVWSLRVLRTNNGVFADLSQRSGDIPVERFLLRDGAVYSIEEPRKCVTRFQTDDVNRFLTNYFHPFVMLLDRERAKKEYTLRLKKQDKWFTILDLKPKVTSDMSKPGVIAIPHRKNDTLPVGVPAAVVISDVDRRIRWDITKWVVNDDNPPKEQEFTVPSAKDGWTLLDWTWPPKWPTNDGK